MKARLLIALLGAIIAAHTAAPRASGQGAKARADWPAYLFSPQHSSFNAQATAIKPGNAASISEIWHWTPPPPRNGQPANVLIASPTVANGRVYIGSNTGVFSALDTKTGSVVWKRFIGYAPTDGTCGARGTSGTATVATDPVSGGATVYVDSGDGYLYALDASTGTRRWRALVAPVAQGYYNWSSPTVSGDAVYLGVAERCGTRVAGGVKAFDRATGDLVASYETVPSGTVGGAVWSSVATDGSSVWASTGDAQFSPPASAGDAYSIVRLDAGSLTRREAWTVTSEYGTDLEFGASPTLFTATFDGVITPMVGACNKNGVFYALRSNDLSAGPVWHRRIGLGSEHGKDICIAAAVPDDSRYQLLIGGNQTTIGHTVVPATLRAVDPATGAGRWLTALPFGPILGTPALDGAGVLAAATYDEDDPSANAVFLVDARTGVVLNSIRIGSPTFAQPVFAGRLLLVATVANGLTAYAP
jgi:polyvinyl alcohol dehydrogenase (cytochrome)